MPLISVIIPMFNAEPWVGEAIESALAQDLRDLECIVVDDGSTDGGGSLARAIGERDSRLRVVSQANRGLSGARNRGIEEARGRYLLFLDADDWLEDGALTALVGAAREPVACAAGWSEWRLSDGARTGWVSDWLSGTVEHADLLWRNRFPTHAALLSRDAIGDDRFDESLTAVEDWDMWLRLSARGVAWRVAERVTCSYRLRAASMSHGFENMAACTRRVIERAHAGATGDAVLAPHLLALATSAAVAEGEDGVERGCAVLSGVASGARFTPEQGVVAAHWMAPFALGLPPNAWCAPDAPVELLAERLGRWWAAMETRGWAARGFARAARAALPGAVVPPCEVVRELSDRLIAAGAKDRGAIVVGYGQNGRLLVRELTERGVCVAACDDRSAAGWKAGGVPVGPVVEPWGMPGAPCVVTPSDDAVLWARVARWDRPKVRWSTTRAALGAQVSARLHAALRAA